MVNFGDAAAYSRVCVRDVQRREVCPRHARTPYDMLPHHLNWQFRVLISDFNKEQYELPEDDLRNGSKHVGAF
jgi:hypothetical protein